MSSRNIQDLDPRLQPLAEEFLRQCKMAGVNAFITCTYRSDAEQTADYAQGRSRPGKIITNAKAGQSAHNCTLNGQPAAKGFDFAILCYDGKHLDWNADDLAWKKVIGIGKSLGLISGSDWRMKDCPHMQLQDFSVPTS